jgi:hypothetical protein
VAQSVIPPQPKLSRKQKQGNKEIEKKVVEWTHSKQFQCKTVRQIYERQWYLNIAFYLGKQNVQFLNVQGTSPGGSTRLYTPPAPFYRSRPIMNLIRPAIRTELAKLTAQKPTAVIVPSTTEDRDLYAAQAGEQIWESIYRDKRLKQKFRQNVMWTLTTGNGFMKTYWDSNAQDKSGAQGDFCYEAVSPFHLFFPDMLCEDIEDQPYVIQITTRTIDWIRLNYPDIKVEPNVTEASDLFNDSFLQLVGATDVRRDSVVCHEVWIKPKQVDFLPNGGMFTLIGDNLVQFVETNPYIHQQFPYAHTRHIPASRFYGESVITDLIPIQREYNRTRGQIIENKNRMGHIKLLYAKGSVDPTKINTDPGQGIPYELGFPAPQPVPPVPLPNYVLQEVDRLRMDFEDISGQHDVSKGQTPPGVTAATAISFLQEQDETMLSSTFQSIEETFEKIGYQTLCLVKQYWNVPRIVKVTGTDGQFSAMTFKGSQIGDNTDIRVEAGSALPTSRAAKQAFIMDLMSQGFIQPEQGLELLDMGGVQRLYDNLKVDNAQASRENLKMSAVTQEMISAYLESYMPDPVMQQQPQNSTIESILGIPVSNPQPDLSGDLSMMGLSSDPMAEDPTAQQQQQSPFIDPHTGQPLVDGTGQPTEPPLIVPVNSYDNHQVHIQVHNNFRKSQAYETLPQETKDLFEQHVNQHLMALGVIPGQPQPTGEMMDSGAAQNSPVASSIDPQASEQQQANPFQQDPQGGTQPNG